FKTLAVEQVKDALVGISGASAECLDGNAAADVKIAGYLRFRLIQLLPKCTLIYDLKTYHVRRIKLKITGNFDEYRITKTKNPAKDRVLKICSQKLQLLT